MNLLQSFKAFAFVAAGLAFVYLYLSNLSLREELGETKTALATANSNLNEIAAQFEVGLKTLNDIKTKKEKEYHYVTTRQTQIIRENNATCLDAINDIFARLREQRAERGESEY